MAILLIGGTGKTAVRLARFLQNNNHQFLLASRRGQSAAPAGMPAVRFDWTDKGSWKEAFEYRFAAGEKVEAIYLMEPPVAEPWKPMNEFIDYARQEQGVGRFVLVAGTSSQPLNSYFVHHREHIATFVPGTSGVAVAQIGRIVLRVEMRICN